MAGRVVPTAWSGVAPSTRIPGVEITAPPTPNMPESRPVASPRSSVRTMSTAGHGSPRPAAPRDRWNGVDRTGLETGRADTLWGTA